MWERVSFIGRDNVTMLGFVMGYDEIKVADKPYNTLMVYADDKSVWYIPEHQVGIMGLTKI